jgi:YHS domain-containing protein
MPNKHFCQGTKCHTNPTTDRFLKSKGIIRGRYAYSTMDRTPNQWGYTPNGSDVYFCSQGCKMDWLNENMSAIEMGIPVPFIRERRITEGYEKVKESYGFGRSYSTIKAVNRVDNDNQ